MTAAHNPPASDDQPVADRRLIRLGSARRRLIASLKHNNKVLHYFVLQAALTGTPYERIAELTGLSPATVTRWVARDTAAARQTRDRLLERSQP
jgi:DNA-directed RNA polymerase specialized sigma24 family protein